jgi:hypothetical protein
MKKRFKLIFKCFLVLMIALYPYLMAIKLIRCAMGLTHIDWFDAVGIILYMFLLNGVIK